MNAISLPMHEDRDLEGTVQRITRFPDGHWVSTVNLDRGTDSSAVAALCDMFTGNIPDGKYETMTFGPDSMLDLAVDHTNTWEEACANHDKQVKGLAESLLQ